MKRRIILIILAALIVPAMSPGQGPQTVKVKIRAALFDRDLNLKPVPRLAVTLRSVDTPSAEAIAAQTTLEGVAELEVKPGVYKLSTSKPAELFDKAYTWDLEVKLLKPENLVELSNDNARITELAGGRGARTDELAAHFKRVKDSVVVVMTEQSAINGFMADASGLILTCRCLVKDHKWLAVQSDWSHKVPAEVVAEDEQNEIVVLRVNPAPLQGVVAAAISPDRGALLEGERVFTLQNSLREGKMMITGVVSRADKSQIVTDARQTAAGTALFNSSGAVVAMSRPDKNKEKLEFAPIEAAAKLLEEARKKVAGMPAMPARLLPCVPENKFPTEALRGRGLSRWEKEVYWSKLGDFEVDLMTPVALYEFYNERYIQSQKERMKRATKGQAPPPMDEPKHEYDSVLMVAVTPALKTSVWKTLNTNVPTFHYKTSFSKMRLLCGGKEVEPIWPARMAMRVSGGARLENDSYKGVYSYRAESISPSCGEVKLEVFDNETGPATVKVFDSATLQRLWEDFAPYRKQVEAARPKTGESEAK